MDSEKREWQGMLYMQGLLNHLAPFFSAFVSVIKTFRIFDALDILLVAYLVYKGILLARETRAGQLVKGILVLIAAYFVSYILQLKTINWLFVNVFQFGLLAVVIVFQPEIRRALETMGRSRISSKINLFGSHIDSSEEKEEKMSACIDVIANAAVVLSGNKTGALMVIERETKLGEIIKTGTVIDSQMSVELIGNIFFPNTPLHDGAMIIRDCRLYAAGCFLPLSQNNEISKQLGTRHRAALGISEVSDAVVVVVSEETGKISVAKNGVLTRNYDRETLCRYLKKELITDSEKTVPTEEINKKLKFRKKKDKEV